MSDAKRDLAHLLETATLAAAAASQIHREHAGRGGAAWTDEKTSPSDFVSNVDLAAQDAALSVIARRHPDHRILAEEEGGSAGGGDDAWPVWIVDPLDGTTNYLHGHPFYAASVAVWDQEGPIAGVVDAPALGRRWEAARGAGATENGSPISTSRETRIPRYLMGTGFPFKTLEAADTYLAQFKRVLSGTAGIRRAGAAAIDLAYVASGILDGFWELHLEPWDVAAGILLVTEAGGAVERLTGGPPTVAPGPVLAANRLEALAPLRHLLLGG
ncbi:MAG: inositol monophosphatase [Gemmatimonadota bacterium]|nr:inositol monophosphatase [Gemmatimonadota bacterium]